MSSDFANRLSPPQRVVHAVKQNDIDYLLKALSDTDPRARWLAAMELGNLRVAAAIQPLLRCAHSASDETLRANAIKSLGEIGDTTVAPQLIEIATAEGSFRVRSSAITALGALGNRIAVGMLAAIVVDRDLRKTFAGPSPLRGGVSPRPAKRWASKKLIELRGVEALPQIREAANLANPLERWRLGRLTRKLIRMNV